MQGTTLTEFMRVVLLRLPSVAPTPWALAFMTEWAKWEGTEALNNPLATTRTLNVGETNFNSHGVKNYPTVSDGVRATIETIVLSYYTEILRTLQNNRIENRTLLANQLWRPGAPPPYYWGTSGFSNLIRNGWNPAPLPSMPGSETDPRDAMIAALRDELARINQGVHRRFDWLAYGANQAEQPNMPPEAPERIDWNN